LKCKKIITKAEKFKQQLLAKVTDHSKKAANHSLKIESQMVNLKTLEQVLTQCSIESSLPDIIRTLHEQKEDVEASLQKTIEYMELENTSIGCLTC